MSSTRSLGMSSTPTAVTSPPSGGSFVRQEQWRTAWRKPGVRSSRRSARQRVARSRRWDPVAGLGGRPASSSGGLPGTPSLTRGRSSVASTKANERCPRVKDELGLTLVLTAATFSFSPQLYFVASAQRLAHQSQTLQPAPASASFTGRIEVPRPSEAPRRAGLPAARVGWAAPQLTLRPWKARPRRW